MGYDYYPLTIGKYAVYRVTEVSVDKALQQEDTTEYYLKEVIRDPFIDGEGQQAFKLERYWRTSDSLPWQVKDVWSVKRDETSLWLNAENHWLIPLTFRPVEGRSWDINAANTEWSRYVQFQSVGQPRSVGANSYDEVAVVSANPDLTLISYQTYETHYAKGVGMVFMSTKDLEINNFDTTDIDKGSELRMQLLEHGYQ